MPFPLFNSGLNVINLDKPGFDIKPEMTLVVRKSDWPHAGSPQLQPPAIFQINLEIDTNFFGAQRGLRPHVGIYVSV